MSDATIHCPMCKTSMTPTAEGNCPSCGASLLSRGEKARAAVLANWKLAQGEQAATPEKPVAEPAKQKMEIVDSRGVGRTLWTAPLALDHLNRIRSQLFWGMLAGVGGTIGFFVLPILMMRKGDVDVFVGFTFHTMMYGMVAAFMCTAGITSTLAVFRGRRVTFVSFLLTTLITLGLAFGANYLALRSNPEFERHSRTAAIIALFDDLPKEARLDRLSGEKRCDLANEWAAANVAGREVEVPVEVIAMRSFTAEDGTHTVNLDFSKLDLRIHRNDWMVFVSPDDEISGLNDSQLAQYDVFRDVTQDRPKGAIVRGTLTKAEFTDYGYLKLTIAVQTITACGAGGGAKPVVQQPAPPPSTIQTRKDAFAALFDETPEEVCPGSRQDNSRSERIEYVERYRDLAVNSSSL